VTATSRLPHQLPSGRHGLSRSFVESNQRERILRAVVEVASGSGYGALTVRDVIERAGVSRRTFYEYFENKEQAFLAAYDLVVGRLTEDVAASSAVGGTWSERIGLGLATFLDRLARDPALAHLCVIEILAAGRPAIGGAYEVVYSCVLQGRTAELPRILPDLLEIVLLPFLGAHAAAAQAAAFRGDGGGQKRSPL
jgi:AcrR family transcriptional regulator